MACLISVADIAGTMPDSLKNHVASAIRAARRSQGLTQEQLASAIDRSAEALSNIERGDSLPNLETLWAICRHLRVPPSDILPALEGARMRSRSEVQLEQEILVIVYGLRERELRIAKSQLSALANSM